MKINVYFARPNQYSLTPIGYIEDESFSHPDRYLDMINWHHRKHASCPEQLHLYSERVNGGKGVCFQDPSTDLWHLALSIGWLTGSKEKILGYIKQHNNTSLWLPQEDDTE